MISSPTPACRKAHEAEKWPDRDAGSCRKTQEGPLRQAQTGPAGAAAANPEQVLVVALARAVAECRAAGQDHAARVAWRALGELLAQPAGVGTRVSALTTRNDGAGNRKGKTK